jgi:hypothetical protein
MKITMVVLLVTSTAFVGGYFLGRHQSRQSASPSWTHEYLYRQRFFHSQEIERVILVLNQFREGNPTNGTSLLERWLDGSLMAAAGCDTELNDRTNGIPTYIQEVQAYRTNYPWTNPVPELDVKVRKILSRAQ